MSFSVLLSVYKKEKPEYLKSSIDSVLNQTLIPNEIVIVKDGPLTSSLEEMLDTYIKKEPNLFTIISLNENKGLGEALRVGVLACKNEIIARMDTDDISLPERFQKQYELLISHPEIDLVGTNVAEFDEEPSNIISVKKVPLEMSDIVKYAKYRNPFNHMAVMFRKKAVLNAGNYKHFLWNEDYYLWIRMLLDKDKVANLPEVLVYVRSGKELYERRGGLKYFQQELKLQSFMLKSNFISLPIFMMNIVTRGLVRVIPNKLRGMIYNQLLRSKNNLG